MTSSPTSTANRQRPDIVPLAASAGEPYAPKGKGSSLDAWVDLMEAVEALCPRWPERSQPIGTVYRL
jgi:hypothetical protein